MKENNLNVKFPPLSVSLNTRKHEENCLQALSCIESCHALNNEPINNIE